MVVQPMQGLIDPPKPDSKAQLKTVDLVVIDRDVQALVLDLEVLVDLVKVNFVVCVVVLPTLTRITSQ